MTLQCSRILERDAGFKSGTSVSKSNMLPLSHHIFILQCDIVTTMTLLRDSHCIFCKEPPLFLLWVTSSLAMSHLIFCKEPPLFLLWATSSSARVHHFSCLIFCNEPPPISCHEPLLAMSHQIFSKPPHIFCNELPPLLHESSQLWATTVSNEPPHLLESLYEPPVDKRPAALPLDFLVFWQNVFVSLSPQGSHVVSSLCIAGHLSYNRYCGRDRTFLICYQDLPCGKRL